jgi:hypothetical protein
MESIFKVDSTKLANVDVLRAVEDIQCASHAVTGLSQPYKRMDIASACVYFNMMLESAWTMLVHKALGKRPDYYSQQAITNSPLKLPCRSSKTARYAHPSELNKLPEKARLALVDCLNEWLPYKEDNGTSICYNRVGYFLMAARFLRDVVMHRTLSIVEYQDPMPSGSSVGEQELYVKVPIHPIVLSTSDSGATHVVPHFDMMNPLAFTHSVSSTNACYIRMSATDFMSGMHVAVSIVHTGLAKILDACLSPAVSE